MKDILRPLAWSLKSQRHGEEKKKMWGTIFPHILFFQCGLKETKDIQQRNITHNLNYILVQRTTKKQTKKPHLTKKGHMGNN